MAKTSEWKKVHVDTFDLQLDTNNYRFPPQLKGLAQPQLLNALINNYNVDSIAESISEKGFYQHELLVVVHEGNKYIVVEGNRRLAACKALLMPDKLPNGNRRKFTQLSSVTDLDSIKKLWVVLAPTREDAIDLIESLHTDPGRLRWDTLSKSRFDKENRSGDKAKLTNANKILDTYEAVSAIPYQEDVDSIVRNESKFNVTNLMRIFNDDSCKKYLGYEYGPKGNLVIKINAHDFKSGAALIVSDVAVSKNFSRLTDKPEDRRRYIEEKKKTFTPEYTGNHKYSVEEFKKEIQKDGKPQGKATASSSKGKSKGRPPKNIIPHDFKCTVNHTRIKKVFKEIHDLPLDNFPNSTAIMLRLLLEISLFQYLEQKGEVKKMRQKKAEAASKKGQQMPAHWTPELKEMLKWISDPKAGLVNGHISKKIEQMIEKGGKEPVLYDLNQMVHNPEEIPDPDKLKKTWSSLEGLFKIILNTDDSKS